jgi:hypothetical protein
MNTPIIFKTTTTVRKPPLGLGIIDGPDDDGLDTRGAREARAIIDQAIGGMSPAARAEIATVEHMFRFVEMAIAVSLEGDVELFQHVKAMRGEIAELRTTVEKLTLASSAPKPRSRAKATPGA